MRRGILLALQCGLGDCNGCWARPKVPESRYHVFELYVSDRSHVLDIQVIEGAAAITRNEAFRERLMNEWIWADSAVWEKQNWWSFCIDWDWVQNCGDRLRWGRLMGCVA